MPTRLFRSIVSAALLLGAAADAPAFWGLGEKNDLPVPGASVGSANGDVRVRSSGGAWESAAAGRALTAGDRIRTGRDGSAVVAFSDGSRLRLERSGELSLERLEPAAIGARLGGGTLDAWVAKIQGRAFEVAAASARVRARGTEFRLETSPSGGATVAVFGGSVQVRSNSGAAADLPAGRRISIDRAGALSAPAAIPAGLFMPAPPRVSIPVPRAPGPGAAGRTLSAPAPAALRPAGAAAESAPAAAPRPPAAPNPYDGPQVISPSSP